MTLVIVLIYLVIVISIIVLTGRRVKTYYDFALGSGSIPWIVICGSIFASTVGGATMIGYVGNYKAYGLQWAMLPFIDFFLVSILVGLLVAPRLRNLNQYTTADMFRIRYGRNTKMIAAVLNVLGEFAVVVSMMASFMTMVSGYLGFPAAASLIAAVVIFYVTATAGGLKGVAYTDLIQAAAIIVTVIIITIICIARGGSQVSEIPSNLFDPLAANMPWPTMSGNIISGALMGFVSQSLLIQRINACKDPRDVRKAVVTNAVACGLFMIVGMGTIGILSNVLTPADVQGNDVITALLSTMPTFLGALYAAAILAAVLTTANSLLLSTSMTFVRDIVGTVRPGIDDKQMIRTSRLFMLAEAIIAMILVMFFYSSVIGWIMITYTVLATLMLPLYSGLLSRKVTPLSGLLGLILGGGGAIVFEVVKLLGALPEGLAQWHSIYIGLIGAVIGILIGLGSKVKSTPEQEKVVDCFLSNTPYNE